MTRFFRRIQTKAALPPGTVEYVGEKKTDRVTVSLIDYDESAVNEREIASIEECFPCRDSAETSWINVTGLHDTVLLTKLADQFGLHPLVLEDIVNTHQRPKLEEYDGYLYIVIKMLDYDETTALVTSEQVSLVLGPTYVLSFQEREGDVFGPIRERIRNGKGRIRQGGADYLAYALLDAIIDHYYAVLENLGEQIESLEDNVIGDPTPEFLGTIHSLKREMIYVRKAVWPLREVVNSLERGESQLIKKATRVFMRDVYDHTIQVIDAVESFRDIISGMQDLYLSSISNRMNEVMKVLTIIATIFVPLTFVAGIYGMNFSHMPELQWRWSYPLFYVVVVCVGLGMIAFFRKKRWL
jgi:magnesium transporter